MEAMNLYKWDTENPVCMEIIHSLNTSKNSYANGMNLRGGTFLITCLISPISFCSILLCNSWVNFDNTYFNITLSVTLNLSNLLTDLYRLLCFQNHIRSDIIAFLLLILFMLFSGKSLGFTLNRVITKISHFAC